MIEEVKDIAEINGWEYRIFETKFLKPNAGQKEPDKKLYGIFVSPPGCETVDFTFRADGSSTGWQFTKTQFAGSAMHIVVVNLLRYISQKYYSAIEVDDEGDYWQTGDETILEKHISHVGAMIKTMADTFTGNPRQKGEDLKAYILRTTLQAKEVYNKTNKKKKAE